MSISTDESQFTKQPALKKQKIVGTAFSGMTRPIKTFLEATAQSIKKDALEFILVFSFATTAIGELFGRNYENKWYLLLIVILTAYLIKGFIVKSNPIDNK